MIQANRFTIIAFLLATVTFSGCKLQKMIKMAQDQQLNVAPSPLEVHANKVEFDVSANLPVKMLKPKTVYSINTFYRYGDQQVDFQEKMEFNPEDFPNGAEQQPQMSKNYSFEYDPAMDPGTLVMQGSAYKVGKPDGAKTTPELEVAQGLITTSLLVQKPSFVAFAAHGYDNSEELIPTNINFYFTQGSSALRSSEKNSNRGSQFQGFVAEKNVTRSVSITGTHSPEGSERVNSNLSEERAQKIEDYYKEQMDKYDYQGAAGDIDFILKPVVESWERHASLSC
jgi:outer membrane protein OmpA-like peptidoglycan-associated protein